MTSSGQEWARYDLAPAVQGAIWSGITSYTVTPPSGAGNLDEVEIQFRRDAVSSPTYQAKLSVSDGQITILDAAAWSFRVPKQVLPLAPGQYFQSVRLLSDDVPPQVYIYSYGTIEIRESATR